MFFPHSGTLKGASRGFKQAQGGPASLSGPGRLATAPPIFAYKTNGFLTFLAFLEFVGQCLIQKNFFGFEIFWYSMCI